MKKNYMMNANDVAKELGVSKGHAYKMIRKLNEELEAAGYISMNRNGTKGHVALKRIIKMIILKSLFDIN